MIKVSKADSAKCLKDLSEYFDVIADFQAFMNADDQTLNFPLGIAQLARAGQTTTYTVRNYVTDGLLKSEQKTAAGFYLYDQCALNRLRFIRAARAAGLLILDIKPLLCAINDRDNNAWLQAVKVLRSKIAERKAYLQSLGEYLDRNTQGVQCGHI